LASVRIFTLISANSTATERQPIPTLYCGYTGLVLAKLVIIR
jgi:hypothetical protein